MATVSWEGAVSGNWATGSLWSTDNVPQAGDSVYIDVTGSPYTVTITAQINAINSLTIGDTSATLSIADAGVVQSITGSLSNSGIVSLTGDSSLSVGGSLDNIGTLAIDDNNSSTGSSLSVAGDLTNSGSIAIGAVNASSDGGSSLSVSGTLTNTGVIDIYDDTAAAMVVTVGSLAAASGQINLYGDYRGDGSGPAELIINGGASVSANISIGTDSILDATGEFVETGGTTTVMGTLSAAGIDITGGRLVFDSALIVSLPITLGGAGIVEFATAVASGEVITFGTGSGELVLDEPGGFLGSIAQFKNGETIDFEGIGLAASYTYSGHVIDLKNAGGTVIAALSLTTPITNPHFILASDGSSGTLLTIQNPNIFTSNYPSGIVLNTPSTQNPATITSSAFVGTGTLATDPNFGVLGTAGFAWTLTNYGHVEGHTNGVYLTAGGTLTNGASGASTAFIEGGSEGVEIAGSAGTVVNFGTILGDDGIYLRAGGEVSNAAGGLIEGDDGIGINAGYAEVANAGTIIGTSGEGILFTGGANVSNAGSGLISGAASGVLIESTGGTAGTVVNLGTIEATNDVGVDLEGGGTVSNSASTALIGGALYGVEIYSSTKAAQLFNLGTIEGVGSGAGVRLGGTVSTLVNGTSSSSTGLIAGYKYSALVEGTSGTVVNYGTIESTSTEAGVGLRMAASGGDRVTNTASGLIEGGAGIKFQENVYATLVNAGTIRGTINYGVFLTGSATISNEGTALISGKSVGIRMEGAGGSIGNVDNLGTIEGLTGIGVELESGGTVANGATAALIEAASFGIDVYSSGGEAASVTNLGTVEATESTGTGVVLHGATNVAVNGISGSSAGLIEGGDVGIEILGTVGTATNYGTVETSESSGGEGIDLGAGGTVDNGASGATSALIKSNGYGVVISGASGTITNFGTIEAIGTSSGSGIWIEAAGSISNAPGGVIRGFEDGVEITGAGSLANEGAISAGTEAGVDFASGGVLTNGASGVTSAVIEGGNFGVEVGLYAGTVVNFATILGKEGVYLEAGGSLVNEAAALIEGTKSGGVYMFSSGGTLTNFGTITAAGGYSTAGAEVGGNVTNGASSDTSALIDGGRIGVSLSSLYGTVVNYGTIAGGSFTGFGAFLGLGGAIVNASSDSTAALIESTSDDGVEVTGRGGTVINYGTIIGAVDGVEMTTGADIVVNRGTIEGLGLYGIDFPSAGATVTNAGTIIASSHDAIVFYGGGNRLIVDPGAAFTGDVFGGNGSNNVLELAAGAGVAAISGIGTNFQEFTTVDVDGGAVWELIGNNTLGAGTTLDNAGTLEDEGTLGLGYRFVNSGTIDVESGARLNLLYGGDGSGRIAFYGNGDVLQIGLAAAAKTLTNSITNFAVGDTIDMAGIVANGTIYAGGVLTLTDNGTVVADLTLSTNVGSPAFSLAADGNGGTDITLVPQSGTTFSGTYLYGIVLSTPSTQNPATIGPHGYVTNRHGGDAVFGETGFAWTVTNDGRIEITGSNGADGIYLADGGFVTNGASNDTGALIEANVNAIEIHDGPGTVVNYGTLLNIGIGGEGVILLAGGTVANKSGGLISGYDDGVYAKPGGTVVNFGSIYGTGTDAAGVNLKYGVVTNESGGLITGFSDGVLIGFGSPVSTGTVVNFGTIDGTRGPGIFLSVGSVINYGRVTNGGSGNLAAAVYGGVTLLENKTSGAAIVGSNGLLADGPAATIVNYGTIEGTFYDGIRLAASGGTVTNKGSATISGLTNGIEVDGAAATVTNSGVIEGADEAGIYVGGGGFVTNAASAAIIGYSDGIEFYNIAGTLVNSGTVSATGDDSAGVDLAAGGVVTNKGGGTISGIGDGVFGSGAAATVVNRGFISGYYYGIELSGPAASIANYGTVLNPSGSGPAIRLVDGGTVDNQGLVLGPTGIYLDTGAFVVNGTSGSSAGTITGTTGIIMNGSAGGTLINYGTIAATVGETGYASGVVATAGHSIANFGSITAAGAKGVGVSLGGGNLRNGASVGSTALISGGHYGVYLGSGGGTVSSYGTISGGVDAIISRATIVAITNSGRLDGTGANSGGIYLFEGSITNESSGVISGNSDGIDIARHAGTVVNSGTIEGTGSSSSGVFFGSSGSVTNAAGAVIGGSQFGVEIAGSPGNVDNLGTIDGTGSGGVGIALGGGGSTLVNDGTIIGNGGTAVSLSGGSNRLIVDPGAVFTGVVYGGSGDDTLELTSASSTGTLAGLGSMFTGFETAVVDPGAVWDITGTAGSPPAFTNDGTIVVNAGALDLGAIGEDLGDNGVIDLGHNGLAVFDGSVAAGQMVDFTGTGAQIDLADASGFDASVTNFQAGDTIDFQGIVADGTIYAGGVLTLTDGGDIVAEITISTNQGSPVFLLGTDGSGGTDVRLQPPVANIFSGFFPDGIVLDDAATQNPATITASGTVTNNSGSVAVLGTGGYAWTVTNYGTIEGASFGVDLTAGGMLTNSADPGYIEGVTDGVEITGSTGTVANGGTIVGKTGVGVFLHNGGTVTNGVSGLISGYANGVAVAGGPGLVRNLGTIEGNGAFYHSGVYLDKGGIVVNGTSGSCAGLVVAEWVGIGIAGGGTVVNYGTIDSLGTQAGTAGFFGLGILMPDGGYVLNRGLIEADGFTAIYIGGLKNVPTPGALGTVVNYGTVESGARNGIAFVAGGTVVNHGFVESGGRTGINISGTLGTVTNLGTVESNAASYRSGIYLDKGGIVVNGSSGSGAGLVVAEWIGVGIAGGGTVVNYGTIDSLGTQAGTAGNRGLAVFMPQGGDVFNQGLIEADGFTAIYVGGNGGVGTPGATGMVTNLGTVVSTLRAGIDLAEGGIVVNGAAGDTCALIEGGGSASVALYIGGSRGTIHTGATGTVVNYGTIENNTTFHSAVLLIAGGSVSNQASGIIIGGLDGITTVGTSGSGGAGTVVNSGVIEGLTGSGVYLGMGGDITNNDTIAGATNGILLTGGRGASVLNCGVVEAGVGILISASDGAANRIVVGGTVIGTSGTAVYFAGGTDTLAIDDKAVFIGNVIGDGGTLELLKLNTGTVSLGSTITGFDSIKVDAGAVWQLSDTESGPLALTNDGTLDIAGQLLFGNVGQDRKSKGTINLAAGATAEFDGSVSARQTFVFTASSGTLRLDDASAFKGKIVGFDAGDLIDIVESGANGFSFAASFADHTLTVTYFGVTVASLKLSGKFQTSDFTLSADGRGGVYVSVSTPSTPALVRASHFFAGGQSAAGSGKERAGAAAFEPFGMGAGPLVAAGLPAADNPLASSLTDPFHFWTLQT